MLASLLRNVAAVAAGAAVPLANADLDGALRELADAWGVARGRRTFAAVDEALDAVERNASPKAVADWVALPDLRTRT